MKYNNIMFPVAEFYTSNIRSLLHTIYYFTYVIMNIYDFGKDLIQNK